MIHLVYVSTATRLFTAEQLKALLVTCHARNSQDNITGMLLYKDGNFMQVLEGPEEAVRATHQRIAGDERHSGLVTMITEPLAERNFPDWTMGFADLRDPAWVSTPGYSDFLDTPLTSVAFHGDLPKSLRLLRMFKKNMR